MEKKDRVYCDWVEGLSAIQLSNIHEVPINTIKSWISKDFKKRDKQNKDDETIEIALSEMEQKFCVEYIKSYNPTQAARIAGYMNIQFGQQLLKVDNIRTEIIRLKKMKSEFLFASEVDLVEMHMRIAFADITDYVTMADDTISVKPSSKFDGQLIQSVQESKRGLTVTLCDKQKSIDWLSNYFMLMPMDNHKIAYDNARLKIEEEKSKDKEIMDNKIEITIEYK